MFSTRWWVALPLAGAVGVAWWLAVATDGRRALGPAAGVSLVIAAKVAFVAASIGLEPVIFLTPAVLVVGGLIASTVDPRVVTTGAVYASLYLPLIFALSRNSDRWILLLVFSIAIALAAATSQVGTKRLARI
jgi:hypothetical protein